MEIAIGVIAGISFLIPLVIWVTLNTINSAKLHRWSFSKWRIIGISMLIFWGLTIILIGVLTTMV